LELPRTYRPGESTRALQRGAGVLFVLGAGLMCVFFHPRSGLSGPASMFTPRMLGLGLAACYAAFGVYLVLLSRRAELRLEDGAVALRGALWTQRWAVVDIAGRRAEMYGRLVSSPASMVLTRKDAKAGRLVIPPIFVTDAFYDTWLRQFPNLDALDANDQHVEQVRYRTRMLAWFTAAQAVAVGVVPHPPLVVVILLAIIPILAVAVALSCHGLVTMGYQRGSPRPNMVISLGVAGGVLLFRMATLHAGLLPSPGGRAFVLLLIVAGFLLTLGFVAADRGLRHPRSLLGAALYCFAFVACAALVTNQATDRSSPLIFVQQVTGKSVTGVRHPTPYLSLVATGPLRFGTPVPVSRRLYDSVEVGQSVCVEVRHGTLGIPWYEIDRCP